MTTRSSGDSRAGCCRQIFEVTNAVYTRLGRPTKSNPTYQSPSRLAGHIICMYACDKEWTRSYTCATLAPLPFFLVHDCWRLGQEGNDRSCERTQVQAITTVAKRMAAAQIGLREHKGALVDRCRTQEARQQKTGNSCQVIRTNAHL